MYFSQLPEHIKKAISNLTTDEVFQQRFGTDKVLDEIQSLKINRAEEFQLILQIFEQDLTFNDVQYPPLTLAVWSFLWLINSPIINNVSQCKQEDLDIIFYLLYKGVRDFNLKNTLYASQGFCENVLQLPFEKALKIILNLINIAFKPLKLFPRVSHGNGDLFFDADWISNIVSKVHTVTGYTPDYIINKLSITACCYYFAQYCRMQGAQNVFRRTDEEILILQMERSVDLICERLIELNVFPPEELNKWRLIMLTPPDKCK